MLAGVLFGLAPLLARPAQLGEALKASGRQIASGAAGRRLRTSLSAAQVTLALVLLIGAGLLLQSFARLLATDLGFRPDGVLLVAATPPQTYGSPERRSQYREELTARLRQVAGVRLAAAIGVAPFLGMFMKGMFSIETQAPPRPG
jgi:putative ABC transport system permease protein